MLRKINKSFSCFMLFLLLFSLIASALPAGTVHAASTPPTLTPRTSPAPDTAHDLEITFPATAAWTSAITGVYDGNTLLTATSQYSIYPLGQSGNKPSVMILAGALSAGAHTIKVTATGYDDATATVTVAAATITPNKKLQNGSFETPAIGASSWSYYLDGDPRMIGWKTTATDHNIEFRNDTSSSSSTSPGSIPIPEGKQFAELNAQYPSTLYQDIMTTPGTTVNWRLYHRGRNGTDTMKVQIGPPGGPLVDQANDQKIPITDGNSAWRKYTGSYLVPDGQTVTRFSFVAVSSANNSPNEGNFLDDIFFGVPPHIVVTPTVNTALTTGDVITYDVKVINNGGDVASNTSATAPIPDGTEYVPGSLQIVSGPGAKQLTDAASDDNGEFDTMNKQVVVRLGDGASPSAGGKLANTDDLPNGTTFRYQVRLTTANSVTNTPIVSYDNLLKDPVQHLTATPDPLTASNTTQTSTTLSWDSVTGATYYDVYKDGVLLTPHVTGTSYVVTGLTPATVYGFTVTAANETKEISQSSLAVARTLSELEDLKVQDKSGNNVGLSPSFSPSTDSYQSTVAADTDQISVTATVYHPSLATVTMSVYDQDHHTVLDSVPLTSGQPSALFPVSVGKNTVELTVTDIAGGTKTYTETVYRLPTVADIEKSGNTGSSVAFAKTDFTNKYPAGAQLTAVKIVTLPSTGILLLNNAPVTAGQEIPADQLGNLTYTPAAGQTGEVTFQWNGTTDGVNYAANPAFVKITLANTPATTANIALSADPVKIVGDGKSTTLLTAVLTDSNGNPISGEEVVFNAPQGTFSDSGTATATAVTNEKGIATVTYKSAKLTGTTAQEVPVTATVSDANHNLHTTGQVTVTFMPATISGILRNGSTNEPIKNATVKVTGNGFEQTITTDVYGAYSIPVPLGAADYTLSFTQTISVGGVDTPVTFTQKATVDASATGGQDVPSVKTAAGIVLSKQPNGQSALLDSSLAGKLHIYLKDTNGNYISENGNPKAFALQSNGVFLAEGLSVGNYQIEIRYKLEDGKELTLAKDATISVKTDGELNISQELIDPYGTITDAVTGAVIEGAQVTLYYADTPNNRNNGIVPGTQVSLPGVTGFAPNDNANPQLSDANGKYAFMVFPNTDYYLVVTKSGYKTYTSPTISVASDIVMFDLQLTPNTSSGGSSDGGGGSFSGSTATVQPKVTLNLSVDKNVVEEGGQSLLTINYGNTSASSTVSGKVKATLPADAEIVDANGGTIDGSTIMWQVKDLAAGQSGSFKITVKWPKLQTAENVFEVPVEFTVDGVNTKLESSVKVQVFSNRYGELKHQRYILGYPDGEFKPKRSITRAELSAIVARLTENKEQLTSLSFTDMDSGHWAANYIKIATKYGYFSGYEDGTFRPEQAVKRGELAAVMARFLKLKTSAPVQPHFTDVKGHWAENAIEELYRNKFLSGYEDGKFRPDDAITRDEAVTMINRMLYRGPLKGLTPQFPDVSESYWAFGDIQEATVSHESTRNSDGSETWKNNIEDDVR